MIFKYIKKYWYLCLVLASYILVFINDASIGYKAYTNFIEMISSLVWIFVFIFFFTALVDYLVNPKSLVKHLQDAKLKKWGYAIVAGILSSGPIYMRYPLLQEFKSKGVEDGLLACFLYNRSIKLPLLPLIIGLLGWQITLILSIIMIVFSVIEGVLINFLGVRE